MVFRYCFSLPQDRFTNLIPEWYVTENDRTECKKYKLKLPINSAIKTPVDVIITYIYFINLLLEYYENSAYSHLLLMFNKLTT